MTFLIRCSLFFALLIPASAQFTCSFAGSKDAADCTAMTDDGNEHCVWCRIGGDATVKDFGFCVSEGQAEAMEKKIPSLHCDRYSGSTDDTPSADDATPIDDAVPSDDAPVDTDDTTPATDDTTPATDDKTPANDDDHSVPDDFWTCLLHKDAKSCATASCTWCDTQGGFGLCMTGPTAESASHSAWFSCHNTTSEAVAALYQVEDTSCLVPEHPSVDACRSTRDASGSPCEWCTLLDLTTLCLSVEQVEQGRALGISCDETADPYDPSCALAYVLDPRQESCVAAVDADNAPCQFCTLSGFDLCLTSEQAAMGQQLGITCDAAAVTKVQDDPYDPSCAIAFLEDPTKEGCVAAVDEDNAPCEFCSLQGSLDLCLTAEQAAMGQQLGVTCDATFQTKKTTVQDDPYDPSCLLAYLQDSSKDACLAAVDEDNAPCEFCSLQGSLDLCLTVEQAEMGEQLGITCDEKTALLQDDPYDPSCLLAYLEDSSKDACVAAVDEDNQPCEFCSFQGVMDLCLTAEQAAMGDQLGITCDAAQPHPLAPYDPSCMAAYWTDQSEQECRATTDQSGAHCHYCSLPGSFVACLTLEQAQVGKALGMQCQDEEVTRVTTTAVGSPLDTTCALAYLNAPTKDACVAASDENAAPCEFCTLQGFGMCLTAEQAAVGEQMGMDCDATVEFPDDFFTCLQHYEEGDCRDSSCTWCNTEVGLGFCMAPAAAESTKSCTFFDCQFDAEAPNEDLQDSYDPVCLAAGMSAEEDDVSAVCGTTNGTDGTPCVWCDAAGVFGLCLSSEQAAAAGNYLQCNAAVAA
jgi:hypothetical protein